MKETRFSRKIILGRLAVPALLAAAVLAAVLAFPAIAGAFSRRQVLSADLDTFAAGKEFEATGVVVEEDEAGVQLLAVGLAADPGWVTETTASGQIEPLPYPDGVTDQAAASFGGRVIVAGGFDSTSFSPYVHTATVSQTASFADYLTPWVTQTAQLPHGIGAAALVVSPTASSDVAYLYFIGGYGDDGTERPFGTVYRSVFTASSGEVGPWAADLPVEIDDFPGDDYGIQYHSAVVFAGHIYVVGGEVTNFLGSGYSNSVYQARIQSDGTLTSTNVGDYPFTWAVLTPTLPARLGMGAAVLYEGEISNTIYFIGGRNGVGGSSRVYYTDILSDANVTDWHTSTANLPSPRWRHGAGIARGQVILAGGLTGGGALTDTVSAAIVKEDEAGRRLVDFCQDLAGNPIPGCNLGSWISGPLLPERRRSHATAVVGNEFFLIGGVAGTFEELRDTVYHGTADAEGGYYPPHGEYDSDVFDLDALYGYTPRLLTHLEWQATVPLSTGLEIHYRVATDSNIYDGDWTVATGSISGANLYTITPSIPMTGGDRAQVQYRAVFSADYPYRATARLTSFAVYADLQAPDLRVSKAPDRAFATSGKAITYTICYTNAGQVGVDVVLTDVLPAYTAINDAGWSQVAGGVYTRAVGHLDAGDDSSTTISVVVEKDHTAADTISDTVLVGYARPISDDLGVYAADPVTGNNVYTAALVIQPLPITITKSVTPYPQAQAGDTITYTLEITVGSGDSSTGVVITDHLGDGIFVDNCGGCDTQTNDVLVWELGEKPSGDVAVIDYTAVISVPVDDGTPIANTAYADSDQWPPVSAALTLTARSQPTLALTKTAQPVPLVKEGNPVTFTVEIANAGTSNAYGVVVTDALDAAALENVNVISGSLVGNVATWDLGPVYVTETARTVVVTATVIGGITPYTIENRAAVTATNLAQPVTSNVTRQEVYNLLPFLDVTKTAAPAALFAAAPLTFTIRLTNTGQAHAENVVVSDTLDVAALENVVVAGGALVGDVATWNVGTVLTGATKIMTVTATAKDVAPYTLQNQAEVVGSNLTGTVWSNVTAQDVEEMTLTVEKHDYCGWQDDCGTVQKGQEVVYTIVAANLTGSDVSVQIEDVITAGGITLDVDYPADSAHSQAGSTTYITWTRVLTAGTDGTVELRVTPTSSPGGFTDTVQLVVAGSVIPGNSIAHRVVYSTGPDITIAEIGGYGGCVYADTQLSFNYTVKNEGTAPVPIVGGVQVPWTQLSVVFELSGTHPVTRYDNLYGYCAGPGLCNPAGPEGWRENYVYPLVPYLQEVPVGYSSNQTLPRNGEKVTLPMTGSWTVTLLADAGFPPDYYGYPCDPDDHGWACEPGHEYNNKVVFHYEVKEPGQCPEGPEGGGPYLPLILKNSN